MKLIQIFSKTPNHKRFNYIPRHFDPQEEERQERERRIRLELKEKEQIEAYAVESSTEQLGYRNRMAGSFKKSKKTVSAQKDPSATMIRLVSLLVVTVGLIGYLEYGNAALYAAALAFIPFYIYLKFRKIKSADED